MNELKTCEKCKLPKPVEEFCPFSMGMCKECDRIRDRGRCGSRERTWHEQEFLEA